MRRIVPAICALMIVAGLVSAQEPAGNRSGAPSRGPEVSEAAQLPYSASSLFAVGIGIIVLEPTISAEGRVESVEVIRSTPGFGAVAVQSVKTWKFRPAEIHGKPGRSKTTVVVVFNQGYNVPPAFSLPPLAERSEQDDREGTNQEEGENGDKLINFSPALPSDVVLPAYPIMSAMTITIVLRAKIDSDGNIDSVTPLRDVATFAPKAIEAIKEWKFSPATLEGLPVRSMVTVAVFFTPAK